MKKKSKKKIVESGFFSKEKSTKITKMKSASQREGRSRLGRFLVEKKTTFHEFSFSIFFQKMEKKVLKKKN